MLEEQRVYISFHTLEKGDLKGSSEDNLEGRLYRALREHFSEEAIHRVGYLASNSINESKEGLPNSNRKITLRPEEIEEVTFGLDRNPLALKSMDLNFLKAISEVFKEFKDYKPHFTKPTAALDRNSTSYLSEDSRSY